VVRKNTEQGLCPIRNKEEEYSHILKCEEMNILMEV
jgi:hypothetical protein